MKKCMYCGKELPTYINNNINACAYGCNSKDLNKILSCARTDKERENKRLAKENEHDGE